MIPDSLSPKTLLRLLAVICIAMFCTVFLRAQGNAVTLNGSSQYATLNTVAGDMASNTTHTIEFWFKAPAQVDAGQVSLFAVNSSTGGNVILLLLGNNAIQTGKIYMYDGASATVIDSSNSTFLDDAPHHVAYVRNGGTATLYVDGVVEGSGACTYAFAGTNLWSVGTEYDSGPTATDFFKGSIDDIRIWNAVRSVDTLQAHMFGLKATNANLKGWWKCDEASGSTLNDGSGLTNTGTLVGSPTFSSSFLPTEPTTAASNIVRSNPTTNSMTISWTRGNGDGCIVVVGNGGDGNLPIDGRTYTASSSWGSGTLMGSFAYVVYKGTGNSVTITNMVSPMNNQTYGFAVYEYKLFHSVENYKATNFNTWYETIDPEPTLQASNVSFSSINTTSFTVNWTRGNGDSCLVVLKAGSAVNSDPLDGTPLAYYSIHPYYNASTVFQSGAQIGTGNYVVYNRTGTSVTVTGLTPGMTYYAAVYELNGRDDWTNFKVPAATGNAQTLTGAPTIQASNVSFASITSSSMTVQWTNGNGSNRLVVMKPENPIPAIPLDGNTYASNSVFALGAWFGDGAYVVYNGTGSSVNVTGLVSNQTYHVVVFEFNTVGGVKRYLLSPATGSEQAGAALPVELIAFTVQSTHGIAELNWSTATEVNNYGFEVECRAASDRHLEDDGHFAWNKAGFVKGNGTTNAPKEYSFTDKKLSAGKYSYRLKQIDRDGKFEYSKEVEVTIGSAPLKFELAQNYPNPFNPTTTIEFSVPTTGKATLKIFNALGQEGETLFDGIAEAGEYHQTTFDAKNLSSGIYFARLTFEGRSQIRKLLLTK